MCTSCHDLYDFSYIRLCLGLKRGSIFYIDTQIIGQSSSRATLPHTCKLSFTSSLPYDLTSNLERIRGNAKDAKSTKNDVNRYFLEVKGE
jgi:hypothetical protein